ncbi:SERPIN domain-containing protein [Aphelenchoides fujianensis]|nr:SERPIN domain-containing protein [Aphelenchoides fujianensis]
MADVAFAAAQTDFAVGLLREAAASSNASLILSPISIALALSLAYTGAGGDTRREFERVFARGGINGNALGSHFRQTFAQLTAGNRSVALELVNRAYVDRKLHVKAAYRKVLTANYGAAFQQVDFKQQPEEAVAEINDFVANATHQKIRDLLSSDDVDADTALVLVNAVYFKGAWDEQFGEYATTDETFFAGGNTEQKVRMMRRQLGTMYGETEDVQVLELPYTDKATKFIVFLPKEKNGLNGWLQKVDGAGLLKMIDRMVPRQVEVSAERTLELPRFKIEANFQLKEALQNLGFSDGFDEEKANFSGISDEQLFISKAIHKAFIDVNENRSEAAAATVFKSYYKSAMIYPEGPARFRADRPFVFLISRERIPRFFGRYMGPSP